MRAADPIASIPLIAGDALKRLPAATIVESLERTLLEGLNIEADPPRLFSPLRAGEFLMMPSETASHAGIKVVTIAPQNTSRGLPRIHAWYLLFDAETLQPLAVVDGAALTLVRTAATTAVAVRALIAAAPPELHPRTAHLVVIGAGPQAEWHIRTLAALLPIERVTLLGRDTTRAAERAAAMLDLSVPVNTGARSSLVTADIIVTVTSSTTPVLGRADVADNAVIAAVGSHGAGNREVDTDLVLVVESRASALRENGNLLCAQPAERWHAAHPPITNLAELVSGAVRRRLGHPALYTGVGMAWEDLAVVATLVASEAATVDES